MIRDRLTVLMMGLFPFWGTCQRPPNTEAATAASAVEIEMAAVPLVQRLEALGLSVDAISFQVDKSERTFTVLADGHVLKTYPCVLGEAPVGDKFFQGDRRTPEGRFTFRSKRVHDKWHKFVWVDYPNAESWRRFKERQALGQIPAGKDIGGEIGIHGVPDGMDHWVENTVDWTWGCIALRNADLDEIYPYIRPQATEMVVVP